jgi:putative hydrolase of the HAD superfamily
MKYKHIFIDLDRTLYDFDKSTLLTFMELYEKFTMWKNGVEPFEEFLELYQKNNVEFWAKYRNGSISKKFLKVERFHVTLLHFGVNDRAFAGRFAADYLRLAPLKQALFPNVREALEYLQTKYSLHVITNGFDQVQRIKMEANDLNRYFTTVTTSEEAGAKKPSERIFRFALRKSSANPAESIMIGDDLEVDIAGARAAGMDQMFVNYNNSNVQNNCTFIISDMKEVLSML